MKTFLALVIVFGICSYLKVATATNTTISPSTVETQNGTTQVFSDPPTSPTNSTQNICEEYYRGTCESSCENDEVNFGKLDCADGKTCCVAKSKYDICKEIYGGTCRYWCDENERGVGNVDCPILGIQKTCCVVPKSKYDICRQIYGGTCTDCCGENEHNAGKIDCLNGDICCV